MPPCNVDRPWNVRDSWIVRDSWNGRGCRNGYGCQSALSSLLKNPLRGGSVADQPAMNIGLGCLEHAHASVGMPPNMGRLFFNRLIV